VENDTWEGTMRGGGVKKAVRKFGSKSWEKTDSEKQWCRERALGVASRESAKGGMNGKGCTNPKIRKIQDAGGHKQKKTVKIGKGVNHH